MGTDRQTSMGFTEVHLDEPSEFIGFILRGTSEGLLTRVWVTAFTPPDHHGKPIPSWMALSFDSCTA